MGVFGIFKTLVSDMFNIVILGRTPNRTSIPENNDLQQQIARETRRNGIRDLSQPSPAKAA